MKSKYRLFIDEYGSSGYRSEKSEKYFFLVGMAIENNENIRLNDLLQSFKRDSFAGFDPDEPPTLHWVEIIKERYGDEKFFKDWVNILREIDFTLFVVGINKEAHYKKRPPNWRYETYSYLLTCMVERYCYLLKSKGATGDVYAESRGKQENIAIKNEYTSIYEKGIIMGSRIVKNSDWIQRYLSSKSINLKTKEKRIAGLETADFFAKPASLFLSSSFNLDFHTYPNHIVYLESKELIQERLYKKSSGEVRGYGLKLLT